MQRVSEMKEYEEGLHLSKEMIRTELLYGKGSRLGQGVLAISRDMRGITQTEYLRNLRKSYYFEELFLSKSTAEYLSKYYSEHYGCSIQ